MFVSQAPHPLLAPFIRCFWFLELPQPVVDMPPMLVLPDGCIELVIHVGTPYLSWQERALQPKALIAGQISRSILLSPVEGTGVFAVRFQPHGLHRFTAMPIYHLTDQEVELEHLWPQGSSFVEPVIEASFFHQRCELANQFFLDLLARNDKKADAMISWCIKIPDLANHRIDALAEKTGLSTRQLERRFRQTIGLSPKRYARIQRLQLATNQLESGHSNSLTNLAYDLGFADQAHMNRDFKQLTGVTPRQYLGKQVPLYFES